MMGVKDHLLRALAAAERDDVPFRHWVLRDVLPPAAITALASMRFAVPPWAQLSGRREAVNQHRSFLAGTVLTEEPACAEIADAFQGKAATGAIAALCGVDLAGAFLRIEYCLDTDGFWLEPHTDIGAKLFTMLLYLSTEPDAAEWGTDLLDTERRLVARSSGAFNSALIFVPAADTWHAFAPRPIRGIRRSLIVNYVKPEWRSRHELAFPDRPVG
jgi:hypothetical protein